MRIALPYPPTVNHYWRNVGGRTIISQEGRAYRQAVKSLVGPQVEHLLGARLSEPVAVHLEISPPDRRRRDLDNCNKALLDSLGDAGVYAPLEGAHGLRRGSAQILERDGAPSAWRTSWQANYARPPDWQKCESVS